MIRNILMSIVKKWGWHFFWLFKIQNNKIVVTSFKGNRYSDNPKYIVEELLKSDSKYKIYWELRNLDDADSLPANVIPLKYESFMSLYHFATAKIWIDNARKNAYMKKRIGQKYIQTWHGGFALKKVEKDAENTLPEYYIKSAKQDSKLADLFIADSKFGAEIFRKAYWYDGEIMMSGLPRNDIVLNETKEKKEEIRKKLNISKEEKIILYAPTFRKIYNPEVYKIDFNKCIEIMENRFGGLWKIGVKLHPGMRKNAADLELPPGKVYDFSDYDDIQELYLVSDVLITDYSSVMFDYMYTKRLCIIYAKDIEDYKKDRGFYVELEELPFEIVTNIEEFDIYISNYSEKEYNNKLDNFIKKYGFIQDGNASKKVVKWIESK